MRLLHSIGIRSAGPLGMTLVSPVLPISRLSSGISIYMLTFTIAQSVVPVFAVYLIGLIGFALCFFLSGSLMIVVLVFITHAKVPPSINVGGAVDEEREASRCLCPTHVVLMWRAMGFGRYELPGGAGALGALGALGAWGAGGASFASELSYAVWQNGHVGG